MMHLPQYLKKLIDNTFIRFLFVGGINTIFGYLLFCGMVALLKDPYISVVAATVIAVIFNFKTYGKLVFKSKDNSKIFRFFAVYLSVMCLQMLLLKLLAQYGLKNPYIAGGLLMGPMALTSFLLMRKFVFYTRSSDNNSN